MCKVSKKLTLSSSTKDISKLNHYWVLHRYVEGNNEIQVGEPMIPFSTKNEDDIKNKILLLKLLNEGKLFDTAITLKDKDKLELSFSGNANDNVKMVYGFTYTNNEWIEERINPFELMNHYNEAYSGKINNALGK